MLKLTHTPLHANRRNHVRADDWAEKQSSVFAQYIDPTHAVLEYGCGAGCILATLADGINAGIESNPALAAAAAEKGIEVCPDVDGFTGKLFDRIILGFAIDTLHNPVQVLADLYPLLSDNGLLLLSEPIDTFGGAQPNSQRTGILSQWSGLLTQAGYVVDDISIKRHSYRSAGFQFQANGSTSPDLRKTYWMVKPFLALVAVARQTV